MPTVFLAPVLNGQQLFDDNGVPLASGFVNTYAAGTTTPTATYTTNVGNVQNANPIALNAAGRITTEVWIPQGVAVKFVPVSSVSQAVGTQLDNIYGINDPTTANGIGYTGATVSGALIMNLAPINEAQGANIPVASAINLTTATGNYLSLTGSGSVTAIQLSQGAYRELVVNTVSASFVNSTTLALLGGTNLTPAVGDILGFRGEGASGIVRNVLYQSAGGFGAGTKAHTSSLSVDINLGTSTTFVDGPSVSCGAVGTWYVAGAVTLQDNSLGTNTYYARIWDGTNIAASCVVAVFNTGSPVTASLSGYFSSALVGMARISVRAPISNNSKFTANFQAAAVPADCTIVAVRVT